jgi:hypothetical protein
MKKPNDIEPKYIEISCSLLYALFFEGDFHVKLPNGTAEVSLKRVRQEHFDRRLGIESGDVDARWDRYGFISYSKASIKLDWTTFKRIRSIVGGSTEDQVLRRVAQTVVNHVIDAYRGVTNEPWARRLTESELFEIKGEITHVNGMIEGVATMIAPEYEITLPVEGLGDRALEEFSRRLDSPEPLAIWDDLWLKSEDAIHRGDYASAVIWGHSALETLSHATIISWLREQAFTVNEAAKAVARYEKQANSLKQSLSLEDLTETLNDTQKVEVALLRVVKVDPSWGFDFCSHFERLAATRNSILHSGAIVEAQQAKDCADIVRAIRAELSNKLNLERINQSTITQAHVVLSALAEHDLPKKLSELLQEIEDDEHAITIWTMSRYPNWLQQSSPVAIIESKYHMRIYLPSKKYLSGMNWELELTKLLIRRKMILVEGWPECDVMDRDQKGNLSLGPLNWEVYRVVAGAITEAILDSVIYKRLADAGFDITSKIENQYRSLEMHIKSEDFAAPEWGELEYYLLPVKALGLHLLVPEKLKRILVLLQAKAPEHVKRLVNIVKVVDKAGRDSPSKAATAMLAAKAGLGVLNTIGVREAPKRILRTRFTEDEIRHLELKRGK